MLKKRGIEPDTIDIEAIWDSSLTPEENYNKFKKIAGNQGEYQKDEVEYYEKLAIEEERKYFMEQLRKHFEDLKKSTTPKLEEYYAELTQMVNTLVENNEIFSLFLVGKAGVGKTFNTVKALARKGVDFQVILGNISPLELYHTLYSFNDEKSMLVFDDTQGLLANKQSMSLLLSALWSPTKERRVCWRTTSKKLKAPPQFVFKGKVIFIANRIPKYIAPTVSRCFCMEVNFNYYEILKIMLEIAKLPHPKLTKEERLMIWEWIRDNTDYTTKDFDLRLQKKIEIIYQHNKKNWKKLALKLINRDEELQLIKQLMESHRTVKSMVKEWTEKTGKSRRTFFAKKRLVETTMGVVVEQN